MPGRTEQTASGGWKSETRIPTWSVVEFTGRSKKTYRSSRSDGPVKLRTKQPVLITIIIVITHKHQMRKLRLRGERSQTPVIRPGKGTNPSRRPGILLSRYTTLWPVAFPIKQFFKANAQASPI
uniref:Uncharacterized protein n=1 Tax=Molossus molossus TaxID=27622 RepID=A0A7J8DU81_MOLMO|nr:hypothetical protein HJG59_009146 [Molossus molossus]